MKKERFEEALNVRRRSVPLSVLVGQSRYVSPMMFFFFTGRMVMNQLLKPGILGVLSMYLQGL